MEEAYSLCQQILEHEPDNKMILDYRVALKTYLEQGLLDSCLCKSMLPLTHITSMRRCVLITTEAEEKSESEEEEEKSEEEKSEEEESEEESETERYDGKSDEKSESKSGASGDENVTRNKMKEGEEKVSEERRHPAAEGGGREGGGSSSGRWPRK